MALKIWKTRSTFAALSLMLAITSCQREALVEDVTLVTQEATSPLETPELAGLEQPMAETRSAVQYYVTPTVGTYTPNSTTSHTLPGKDGCASFHGGRIKARVKSQNGNNFVVEIATQSDSSFGINGQAYVKAYSVCGPIAGNTSFVRTDKTIEITITPTFKQGIAHYYPVIIDAKGFRYYAEPLLVYTVPMHSTRYGYGVHLGTVNGVTVYGAGAANIAEEGHNYYQCVEFCRRYYKEIYNLPFSGWGTLISGLVILTLDLISIQIMALSLLKLEILSVWLEERRIWDTLQLLLKLKEITSKLHNRIAVLHGMLLAVLSNGKVTI